MIQVIVPVYNGFDLLQRCVIAVRGNTQLDYELVVADDHSPDTRLVKWCKKEQIKVIQNGSGVQGFPHNCNWAAKQSDSTFICLLNSDTEVKAGWLQAMLDEMDEPSVGIVGAKLIYPMAKGAPWGGTIQHAGVARNSYGLPFHIYRGLSPRARCVNVLTECNAVTFACVLIRRQLWNELGGLDERYVGGQFEDVDFCLYPDEPILTPTGVRPICSLEVGDMVMGATGVPETVRNTMSRHYTGEMIRLRRVFGDPLWLTANHPVLTKDGWKRADNVSLQDMVWCPGMAYMVGDRHIDIARWVDGAWRIKNGKFCFKGQHTKTRSKDAPLSVELSDGLARVFGYYLAEGDSSGNNLEFTFNETRTDLISDCREMMLEIFRATPYERDSPGAHKLIYSSKALSDMFANLLGAGAANKHLPEEVFYMTREERENLLRAMWHCDGHISDKAVYTTISPHLAYQVTSLAASLGFVVANQRRKTNQTNTYQLFLSQFQLEDMRGFLGYSRQTEKEHKYHHPQFLVDEARNGIWVRVKEVQSKPVSTRVYNISVDREAYVAQNMVVHNCWRAREKGWRVVYTPRAVALHLEHGAGVEFVLKTEKANSALLLERFGNLPSDEHLFQDDGIKSMWGGEKFDKMAALCHYWRGQNIKWVADREHVADNFAHCRRLAALPFADLPDIEKDHARAMARNILTNLGKMLED